MVDHTDFVKCYCFMALVILFQVVFAVAEELLRTASQNTTLTMFKTQAGWLLIGSLMTLGNRLLAVMVVVSSPENFVHVCRSRDYS